MKLTDFKVLTFDCYVSIRAITLARFARTMAS
jgi:hypothetical protein